MAWPAALSLPSGSVRLLALALFFGSGLTALIYEVLWTRRLTLVFGHSVLAVSTVVTAFMLGLALGSLAGGRWVDRRARDGATTGDCLRAYGWLEAGIGAWALASPLLLALVERLHWTLAARGTGADGLHGAALAASLLALTPPTFLMGATLPILSRVLVNQSAEIDRRLPWLYAVNTLGAAVGACLAGFWMLPALGLRLSLFLTAAANLALAGAAHLQASRMREPLQARGETPCEARPPGVLALAMALAGVASMGFQLAWTRSLAQIIGSSTYAFSVILAVFLAGLGLGSALLPLFRLGRRHLALILVGVGLVGGLSHLVLGWLPYARLQPLHASGLASMLALSALAATLVVLPATLLMGVALPLASALEASHLERLGRSLSRVYSANTAGCILGATAVGFLAIPGLGVQLTLKLAAVLYLVTGMLLWRGPFMLALAGMACLGVLALPPWDLGLIGSGPGIYTEQEAAPPQPAFYRDGLSSTVTLEVTPGGSLVLRVNGKTDASLHPHDLQTQFLCGYLPGILHPRPETVLVIGLGSGLTAHSFTNLPTLNRLTVVELEPAVVAAQRFWGGFNGNVLRDPRVRLQVTDGRTFMQGTRERYDVIASEPSNPWIAGVASLYTREFYRTCRTRLRPGGIMCQWFHLYGVSSEDVRRVLSTFFAEFPHGSVWESAHGDLLLIGSEQPVHLNLERVRALYRDVPGLHRDMCILEMFHPESLAGYFLVDRDTVLGQLAIAPLNTDDLPLLEFSAPLSFGRESASALNWEVLAAARGPEPQLPPGVERSPANLIAAGHAWVRLRRYSDLNALLPHREAPGCRIVVARAAEQQADPSANVLYRAAMKDAREDPVTLWLVALYRLRQGDLHTGEALLQRLRERPLVGFEEQVRIEHSRVLSQMGKNEQALDEATAATAGPSATHLAWTQRGKIERALKRYPEAARSFERALKLNPYDLPALVGLAETLVGLKRPDEAAEAFRRVLELRPAEVGAWYNLGLSLQQAGRNREALQAYRKVVELNPEHPKVQERMLELAR